tara:strand:- start:477 stop:965 length:489 start_codon:yes stop_codon:yes gene_type:complete
MFQIIKLISILFYLNFMLINHMDYKDSLDIKCMIQMSNYEGEAAYIVISLIDSNGNYEKTLYVQGKDSEWYNEIYEWWKFYGIKRSDLSAISGATISGGERKISIIKIPTNKIDNGYSIRFETAVEDQKYFKEDLQFELNSESVNGKFDGKGYIRYIKMMPQ